MQFIAESFLSSTSSLFNPAIGGTITAANVMMTTIYNNIVISKVALVTNSGKRDLRNRTQHIASHRVDSRAAVTDGRTKWGEIGKHTRCRMNIETDHSEEGFQSYSTQRATGGKETQGDGMLLSLLL